MCLSVCLRLRVDAPLSGNLTLSEGGTHEEAGNLGFRENLRNNRNGRSEMHEIREFVMTF